jgi:flavin reductase (DIM6/NTAB) family NADH-FMN oxidoreductase RutF
MNFAPVDLCNVPGSFATGIGFITAASEGFVALGMTINLFSSLSQDMPLIFFCCRYQGLR